MPSDPQPRVIDCHAHVYPKLSDHMTQLPSEIAGLLGAETAQRAEHMIRGVYGRLHKVLGGLRPDAEKISMWRRSDSSSARQMAEISMNLASAPQILLNGTVDDLLVSMDKAGVTQTAVIGTWPLAPNEWIAKAAADSSSRLVAVAHVPRLPETSDESQWAQAYEELVRLGFVGFKIHPNFDGLPADHAAYRALFGVAKAHDCSVTLHTGHFVVVGFKRQGASYGSQFESLIAEHPSVRVCLAHMHRDEPEGAWDLMRRHDNVWTDTSWQPTDVVRRAIDRVGVERLMLGSDWPLLHPNVQIDAAAILREACSNDEELERIGVANAQKFFRLGP